MQTGADSDAYDGEVLAVRGDEGVKCGGRTPSSVQAAHLDSLTVQPERKLVSAVHASMCIARRFQSNPVAMKSALPPRLPKDGIASSVARVT